MEQQIKPVQYLKEAVVISLDDTYRLAFEWRALNEREMRKGVVTFAYKRGGSRSIGGRVFSVFRREVRMELDSGDRGVHHRTGSSIYGSSLYTCTSKQCLRDEGRGLKEPNNRKR